MQSIRQGKVHIYALSTLVDGTILMRFRYILCLSLLFNSLQSQSSSTLNRGDILSETPLYPVPQEMTFEEYQDMNRRLSQGFIWSAIPIPGVTHYYAGEKAKANAAHSILEAN